MELRSSFHLHFIQAIKGDLVTKVPNVTHGRPTLSFKEFTDIYGGFMFDNDSVETKRSCVGVMEERTVKTELEASLCNAKDDDDQRICNLDDNGFDSFTLKQIKERCKTRKRKHSDGLNSSKREIKIEALSSPEDYGKKRMAAEDSDFMETLSSWRSKLSKNMKAKKRKCIKDPISTYSQEIMPVVKSEEIENGQEFPPSSGDSFALIQMKLEVPEADSLDPMKELINVCDKALACHEPEVEITHERNLEYELNYDWKQHADFIPLQMVWPCSADIVVSNSELNSDQSPNLRAIEFESEECIIHPDLHYISPQAISLVEDHDSDIYDSQPDGDTPVSLPDVATHKGLDCVGLSHIDDSTSLGDCSKDEFTSGTDVQAKTSSTSEHGFNPGECLVCNSDDLPENDEEKRHVTEATDEFTCWDIHRNSSKLHRPERLLSTRKAISPSSQERLCKAMQSIGLHLKDNLKCRGKLNFCEQTDKKNFTAEGLDEIMRARFTDNRNKIKVNPKTFKCGSHHKGIRKIPHPSRPATHLGSSSVPSCSKSAIAFSKQQVYEVECIAMKLTRELKSMKDIVDDMLRSEFCLNTSLKYKVNEAIMAVKKATRAEETAKRSLSIMARDCSRFCKIMKLAEGSPSAPQNVVRKERKKISFADEAGGRLCQVMFFEDDLESN